jgi:hypothetical protein
MIHGVTGGTATPHEYFDRVLYAWYHVSESGGLFEFNGLSPGPQDISVRASGYRPLTIEGIVVGAGEAVGPIEFRLERSPSVEGTIVDSRSEPVSGAVAEITETTFVGEAVIANKPEGTTSASNGKFMLDSAPMQTFTLVIRYGESRAVFRDLSASDFPARSCLKPRFHYRTRRGYGSDQKPASVFVRRSTGPGSAEVRPDGDGGSDRRSGAGDYRVELIDD